MKFRTFSLLTGLGILGLAACSKDNNNSTSASPGTVLYALNSGEATISVFNLANAQAPALLQTFALKNAGPLFGTTATALSSQPFAVTFAPDEQTMFIVSQHSNPDYTTNYNYLHVLSVASDGKLSEPGQPVQPPVPATARPQGAVSLTL